MRTAILLAPLVLLGCGTANEPDEPDEPGTLGDGKADGGGCATLYGDTVVHICNFHEVSPGVFRGARPGAQGIEDLAALGIRTDIDLEKIHDEVEAEADAADRAGIDFVPEPMSYLWPPKDAFVDEVLALLADPDLRPVYVHCKLGNDRTGTIVALHRVENEGWDPADAWQEALDLGFHRIWVALSHYYEERTGWDD